MPPRSRSHVNSGHAEIFLPRSASGRTQCNISCPVAAISFSGKVPPFPRLSAGGSRPNLPTRHVAAPNARPLRPGQSPQPSQRINPPRYGLTPSQQSYLPNTYRCHTGSIQRKSPQTLVPGRSKPVAQHSHQRPVRRRHRIPRQLPNRRPFQCRVLARPRHALPLAAGKERHQQVEIGVGMAGETERREATRPGVDAQLLVEFADRQQVKVSPPWISTGSCSSKNYLQPWLGSSHQHN